MLKHADCVLIHPDVLELDGFHSTVTVEVDGEQWHAYTVNVPELTTAQTIELFNAAVGGRMMTTEQYAQEFPCEPEL